MRRLVKALLILIIGLPVLAAAGYWYVQQQIAGAGISNLQLDVDRLTLRSAAFARVRFTLQQQDTAHQIDLQNVELSWLWPQAFKPALQRATVGSGSVTLASPLQTPAPTDAGVLRLPQQWQLPDWLPQHLAINNTRLLLPCPAGSCQLQLNGHLSYHPSANTKADVSPPDNGSAGYWQSQLTINIEPPETTQQTAPDQSELRIDATYRPLPQPGLELTIQQAQQVGLSLKQQINPDSQLADTELVLALSPPSPANQALLQQWGIDLPQTLLEQFQQPVQLYSKLQWQLPADGDLSNLLSRHDIEGVLIARAPDPFYIPQLGLIRGELNAELRMKNQLVERWQLNASGTLSELQLPASVNDYGINLNPLQFQLTAETADELNLAALPLQLTINTAGDNNFTLNSALTVNLTSSPKVDIQNARLVAKVAELLFPDNTATLKQLVLNTGLSGYWQAGNWQLALADDSNISGSIASDIVNIGGFTATATNSSFTGDATGLTDISSNLIIRVNTLNHPALHSQNWQWQGKLSSDKTNIVLTGAQLSNDAGLMITHSLQYQPLSETLTLDWQLAEIFLLAGNPLADTLAEWPELLTINRGKITASGDISINNGGLTSSNQLLLGDVAGIYDRSLFAGLNSTISVAVADNSVQLSTADLQLNRLNYGFEMGPLRLMASASLPIATPEQLQVNLQQAELQVMQGIISANEQQLNFGVAENQLILQLQQIDLASLLQQHPSSDLTGNGKLSGTVPITINAKGVSVKEGLVAAEAPGGRLQYKSDSTSAMAKTNTNMKLVFDALENFQYSILSSKISYDTSGKLILGLKLHGSNPTLQQGRAINLNVNLEEDLPALITSLQLTNKLNDVITQRVQQYLKQQQAAAAANGEKP